MSAHPLTTAPLAAASSNYAALAGTLQGQLQLLALELQSFSQGDFKQSVAISSALLSTPNQAAKTNLYIRRAMAYLELHRFQDALDDAEQALGLAPTNARAHALVGYASHGLAAQLIQQKSLEKAVNRLNMALSYLHKASVLDASLAAQTLFAKTLQSCYALVSSQPVLSPDEGLLVFRANELAALAPAQSDGAHLKAELLFFLASLHRRCLQTPAPLIDNIFEVRTLNDFRQALAKVEMRFSFDIQLPSWKTDRAAWLHGVTLASSAGELFVCLRALRGSLRRSSFESVPEIVVAQIRAVANDIDAYGDTGLGCMHKGEYRDIYLALLARGIESVSPAVSSGLRLARARCLLAVERAPEALVLLSGLLANHASAFNRADLDAIASLRDQAAAKSPPLPPLPLSSSVVVAAAAAASSPSPPPLPAASPPPPPPAASPACDALLSPLEHVMSVSLQSLERGLGALRHRALPLSQETIEHLALYAHPPAAPPSASAAPPSASATTEASGDALAAVRALAQGAPASEREQWASVEAALARAMDAVRTAMVDHLGAVPEPLHLHAALARAPELRPDDAKARRVVERSLLQQRSAPPVAGLDHGAVVRGWADDRAPWIGAGGSGGGADFAEDDDADEENAGGLLLFDDVYFVPSSSSSLLSTAPLTVDRLADGGRFVCEACAKVCHAGSPAFLVGRAPLAASECGPACRVTQQHPAGAATQQLQVQALSHDQIKVALPAEGALECLARHAEMHGALAMALAGLDDEASLLKHYLRARDEAAKVEQHLGVYERLKWAFEYLTSALRWTHQVHRALARRMDPGDMRQACDFLRKSLQLLGTLKQAKGGDQAAHLLLGGPVALSDVLQALSQFEHSCREHNQTVLTRDEMAHALARDEEKLLQASSSLAHPPAEIGLVQQQLSDEYDTVAAQVFSKTQQVGVLESRLADSQAAVASQSQMLLRKLGGKCREAAMDVLVCVAAVDASVVSLACAETGVAQHEKLNVLWRSEAPPEDLGAEERARIAALSKRLKDTSDDVLEQLARAAASTLASWPAKLVPDAGLFETVLQPVESATERIKDVVFKLFDTHLVQHKLASPVFPSRNFNPLQALQIANTTWNRIRQDHLESHARLRWRRSELFRFVHVRNQLLLSALADCVLAEMRASQAVRDVVLSDDEDAATAAAAASRKPRRRHKRKAAAAAPVPSLSPPLSPPAVAVKAAEPLVVAANVQVPAVEPEAVRAAEPEAVPEAIPMLPSDFDDVPEQKEAEWVVVSRAAKRKASKPAAATAAVVATVAAAVAAAPARTTPPSPASKFVAPVRRPAAVVAPSSAPAALPPPVRAVAAPVIVEPSLVAVAPSLVAAVAAPSPADEPPTAAAHFLFGRFDEPENDEEDDTANDDDDDDAEERENGERRAEPASSSASSSIASSSGELVAAAAPLYETEPYMDPVMMMHPDAYFGPPGPSPPPLPPMLMPPPMRPVCPYFAQGMCRYGQRCRDLHVYPMFSPPPLFVPPHPHLAPLPPPPPLPHQPLVELRAGTHDDA